MKAGIPKEIPASIVNMLCGSGLRSVAMAMQAIKCGDADIIVAGGQESMSQVSRYILLCQTPHIIIETQHYFSSFDWFYKSTKGTPFVVFPMSNYFIKY